MSGKEKHDAEHRQGSLPFPFSSWLLRPAVLAAASWLGCPYQSRRHFDFGTWVLTWLFLPFFSFDAIDQLGRWACTLLLIDACVRALRSVRALMNVEPRRVESTVTTFMWSDRGRYFPTGKWFCYSQQPCFFWVFRTTAWPMAGLAFAPTSLVKVWYPVILVCTVGQRLTSGHLFTDPISQGIILEDYIDGDGRLLSLRKGEVVTVYSKIVGGQQELWEGRVNYSMVEYLLRTMASDDGILLCVCSWQVENQDTSIRGLCLRRKYSNQDQCL